MHCKQQILTQISNVFIILLLYMYINMCVYVWILDLCFVHIYERKFYDTTINWSTQQSAVERKSNFESLLVPNLPPFNDAIFFSWVSLSLQYLYSSTYKHLPVFHIHTLFVFQSSHFFPFSFFLLLTNFQQLTHW